MLNTRKVGLAKHVLQPQGKRLFSTTHFRFETQQTDDKKFNQALKTLNETQEAWNKKLDQFENKIGSVETDIKEANKQIIEQHKKEQLVLKEVEKKISKLTSTLNAIESSTNSTTKKMATVTTFATDMGELLINMFQEEKVVHETKSKTKLLLGILCALFLFLSTLSINLTLINNLKFFDFEFSFSKLPLAVGFLSFFLFLRKLPKKEQFGAIGLTLASLIGSEYVRSEDNRVGSASKMFKYLIENHDSSNKMAFSLKLIDRYSGDFNTKQDIMDHLLDFLQHYYSFFTIFNDATIVKTVDKIPTRCLKLNDREKRILPEIFVNLEPELNEKFFELYFKTYYSNSTAKHYLLIEEYLRQKNCENLVNMKGDLQYHLLIEEYLRQNCVDKKDVLKNLYALKDKKCSYFFCTYINLKGGKRLLKPKPELKIAECKMEKLNNAKSELKKTQDSEEKKVEAKYLDEQLTLVTKLKKELEEQSKDELKIAELKIAEKKIHEKKLEMLKEFTKQKERERFNDTYTPSNKTAKVICFTIISLILSILQI